MKRRIKTGNQIAMMIAETETITSEAVTSENRISETTEQIQEFRISGYSGGSF